MGKSIRFQRRYRKWIIQRLEQALWDRYTGRYGAAESTVYEIAKLVVKED